MEITSADVVMKNAVCLAKLSLPSFGHQIYVRPARYQVYNARMPVLTWCCTLKSTALFGIERTVRISAYCEKSQRNVNEPEIGCGLCHPEINEYFENEK